MKHLQKYEHLPDVLKNVLKSLNVSFCSHSPFTQVFNLAAISSVF